MSRLPALVESYAASLPEGVPVQAKALLHLANRAAVDQALSRLARQGRLLRVGRGAYVAPVAGRFGSRPPAVEKVVEGWASQRGETVVPHGGLSANRLGLSTQVPVRAVYLTDGATRKLKVGKQEVELRHAPRRMLALGRGEAGEAVRALEWLGREHAATALARMTPGFGPAQKRALLQVRGLMPAWLSEQISRAVTDA